MDEMIFNFRDNHQLVYGNYQSTKTVIIEFNNITAVHSPYQIPTNDTLVNHSNNELRRIWK
jgi:uncharacterized protein (DUF1330 family)